MERHFHEDLRALTEPAHRHGRARRGARSRRDHGATSAPIRSGGESGLRRRRGQRARARSRRLVHQVPRPPASHGLRSPARASVIKVNTDLERIGDQAVNIAQGVIRLLSKPLLRPTFDVARLGGDRRRHAARQPDVLRGPGRHAGAAVLARDDEADELARRHLPRPAHPHDGGPGASSSARWGSSSSAAASSASPITPPTSPRRSSSSSRAAWFAMRERRIG